MMIMGRDIEVHQGADVAAIGAGHDVEFVYEGEE